MLPLIADRENHFSRHEIDVRTENIQTGKLAMDALQSGSIDLAVLVDSNLAFGGFQSNPKFKAVSVIQIKWDDAILYRTDSGIQNAGHLKGRQIATPLGTTAHVFAAFYLEDNGIAYDEVEFVNMSPPGIQAAFIAGDLQAGAIWQPFRYNVRQALGDEVGELNDPSVYKAYAILAASTDILTHHPKAVGQYLAALSDAQGSLRRDEAGYQEFLAHAIGISVEVLRTSWSEYDVSLSNPAQILPVLQREGEWIRRTQEGYRNRALPDYGALIDDRFWRELKEQGSP